MKIKSRKLFAILVIAMMVITLLPITAFAASTPVYGVTAISVDATEVETGDGVEFTLTFYDSNGNPYVVDTDFSFDFYLRSSRGAETITQYVPDGDSFKEMEDIKGEISNINVTTPWTQISSAKGGDKISVKSLTAGQLTFLVSSSFSGSSTLYFYDDAVSVDDRVEIARETITFSAAKVSDVKSSFVASATSRSLFDNLKLTATVRDNANKLVRDEEVTFQKRFEGGAWSTIETKKTDALGEASINTTESEAGKYDYRARIGTTTLDVTRKVEWSGTRATKIDGTVAESVALDEEITITFKVTDAFDNGVNTQAVKFEIDSRPAGASSKTESLLPGAGNWKNGEVKFKYTPKRTGEYKVKATVLDRGVGTSETGLSKVLTFKAVDFGEVDKIVVKPEKDRVSVKSEWDAVTVGTSGALQIDSSDVSKGAVPQGSWMKIAVELFDENGVKSTDVDGKIILATSNPRLVSINPYKTDPRDVVASSSENRYGVVTISATHIDTGKVASFELPVVGNPHSIDTDVTVSNLVANVTMQFVDADGNKTWDKDGADTGFTVVAPPGVSISHSKDFKKGEGVGEFRATAEKGGNYTLTVVSDNGLSKTFDIAPVPEKADTPEYGAGNLVMFVGSTSFVTDGKPGNMDSAPFIEDGRTFVPVRFLAEGFGAEADWDPKDGAVETVTLTRDDMVITIKIGSYVIEVEKDGEVETVTSDVAAFVKDGRTVLPFRAIAEAFGADVDYGPKDGPIEWVSFQQ